LLNCYVPGGRDDGPRGVVPDQDVGVALYVHAYAAMQLNPYPDNTARRPGYTGIGYHSHDGSVGADREQRREQRPVGVECHGEERDRVAGLAGPTEQVGRDVDPMAETGSAPRPLTA
jgi:hypothetical protein